MATEKRLIDANLLLEHLTRCIEASKGLMRSVCVAIKCFVEQMPAVDTVEVMHGQWIRWYPPMHMIMTGEEMLYRCSSCDAKYPDVEGYRFCPHCGAKMDGGAGNG